MRTWMVGVALVLALGCATQSSEDVWRKAGEKFWNGGVATKPNSTSTTSVLAGEEEKIRPYCEKKWSGNFSGMALCVDMQTDGFRTVQRFVEEHGVRPGDTTPEAQIFDSCSRKWRNSYGGPNWSGTGLCVEMQWDGYGRLNPGGARPGNYGEPTRCAALGDDSERLACFDKLASGARSVEVAPDTGMWEVLEETNPLDDSMAVVLALEATGDWSMFMPAVVLVLRCMDGETEVYVDWRKHLIFEDKEVDVVSRVGRAKAVTQRWGVSSDNEATFFLGNAQALIKNLMIEDRFVAQAESPNSNPITAAFELQGIEAAVAPLLRVCGR